MIPRAKNGYLPPFTIVTRSFSELLRIRERPSGGDAFRYPAVAKTAIVKLPKDRTEETALIANDAPGFFGVLECCNTFWIVF